MNTKILLGSLGSVTILILVSFTNVVCSDVIISNEKKEQRNNIEISDSNNIDSIKIKYFIVELKTLSKMIMRQYSNYPDVISSCQVILENLDILLIQWPDVVCLIILTISETLFGLSELIYILGFLLISQIVLIFSVIFYGLLFVPHCDYYFPYDTKEILRITSKTDINKLTKTNSCPCNQE